MPLPVTPRLCAVVLSLGLAVAACSDPPDPPPVTGPAVDDPDALLTGWEYAPDFAADSPVARFIRRYLPSEVQTSDEPQREIYVIWISIPCRRTPQVDVERGPGGRVQVRLDDGPSLDESCEDAFNSHGLRLDFREPVAPSQIDATIDTDLMTFPGGQIWVASERDEGLLP